MLDLSPALIALCSIICFVAATMVGFSGFGFALIAVPLMTLVLPLKSIVPMEVLLASFCVVILSANKLRLIKEPGVIFIFAGMATGIFVGVHLLAKVDAGLLKKILGFVVIVFAIHMFMGAGRERNPQAGEAVGRGVGRIVAFVVGVLSGVAGGMFGTSGPPLVVYVDHFAKDKTAFRAQLVVLFLFNNLFRAPLYVKYSIMTMESVKSALWMLPAVCLGLFLGTKMHFQVSEKTFGRAISAMLLVSGLLLIIRP